MGDVMCNNSKSTISCEITDYGFAYKFTSHKALTLTQQSHNLRK